MDAFLDYAVSVCLLESLQLGPRGEHVDRWAPKRMLALEANAPWAVHHAIGIVPASLVRYLRDEIDCEHDVLALVLPPLGEAEARARSGQVQQTLDRELGAQVDPLADAHAGLHAAAPSPKLERRPCGQPIKRTRHAPVVAPPDIAHKGMLAQRTAVQPWG